MLLIVDPYIPNIYIYIYIWTHISAIMGIGIWFLIMNLNPFTFIALIFYHLCHSCISTLAMCHSCISIDSILAQWLSSSTSRCNISFPKKGKKIKCNTFLKKSVTLLNKPKQKSVTLFLFHKLSIKEKKKKNLALLFFLSFLY